VSRKRKVLAADIRYYLDENVPVVIADQLRRKGIDVVTVRDIGRLGDSNENHLQRATKMQRILCTHDQDFLRLAADGKEHAGIVFGIQDMHTVGDWVRGLELIHAILTEEDMKNHVEYL
jgi:predicted nuclease of predicted toxin-antitoxin system